MVLSDQVDRKEFIPDYLQHTIQMLLVLENAWGAKCSADKFQSALVEAFRSIEGVEVYQDDILIHGRSMAEHNNRLDKVLQCCWEINLKLNQKKCKIGQREVNYIGHKQTIEGLKAYRMKSGGNSEHEMSREHQ